MEQWTFAHFFRTAMPKSASSSQIASVAWTAGAGGTELKPALTPNLDHRERAAVTGLTYPVRPGVTPGRLALFGGDPSGWPT